MEPLFQLNSHRYFACPSLQRSPCLNSELFHQRTVARRKPCLRGSEEDQATEPGVVTKRALPNVSITVAGTSDGTYWGGQPCVRNTASKVLGETHEDREQESRTGGSGEGRVTAQGRHFGTPRWRSWSGTSLRDRAAIRSGLQVSKGLATGRAAEHRPAETRHWRGAVQSREVNSTVQGFQPRAVDVLSI